MPGGPGAIYDSDHLSQNPLTRNDTSGRKFYFDRDLDCDCAASSIIGAIAATNPVISYARDLGRRKIG